MSLKFGMLAEYATPADLMHAAEKIRDAGFRRWDVFSPYPIHGMNQAMGLKNTAAANQLVCSTSAAHRPDPDDRADPRS